MSNGLCIAGDIGIVCIMDSLYMTSTDLYYFWETRLNRNGRPTEGDARTELGPTQPPALLGAWKVSIMHTK